MTAIPDPTSTHKKGIVYNLGIITLLLVISQAVYLYYTVIPSIEESNISIANTRVTLAQERERLSELEQLSEQQEQLYEYINLSYNVLPTTDMSTSIPFHLLSVAQQSNVTVTSIDIGEPFPAPGLKDVEQITIPLRIDGDFEGITKFVATLNTTNRITTTEQLELSGTRNTGRIRLNLDVNFYYQTLDD